MWGFLIGLYIALIIYPYLHHAGSGQLLKLLGGCYCEPMKFVSLALSATTFTYRRRY